MNVTLALCLALPVLGIEGPPNRGAPDISYTVRVLTMNGLDWRGAFFTQLQPVTSQAGATVWTVGRETALKLADRDPKGMRSPRINAASQSVAHIAHRVNRKVSSGLNRLADGPFDQARQVAYAPSYEEVREGWAITLSGRKIDQGVLACVVLDDTRIAAVHQVTLTERVAAGGCCDEGGCSAGGKTLACRIEVPEVAHAAASGEWLIPNDSALVVSLGVQTTADEDGKAVVVERLVVIEARPATDAEVKQTSLTSPASLVMPGVGPGPETSPPVPTPFAMPADRKEEKSPLTMPAMPSRSLPQARAVDGSPMALPPLPENPATPSTLPGSSEPCASPQAPNRRAEPSSNDADSSKAGFTPEAKEKVRVQEKSKRKESEAEPEANNLIRPCLLRVPIKAGGFNLDVEVRAVLPFLIPGKSRSVAQEK